MINPTDKRPLEFVVLIIFLLSGVPESMYSIISGENEYPLLSSAFVVFFVALAIGLWLRKEIARRFLIETTALLVLPAGIAMFFILGGVSKGDIQLLDALPFMLSVIALIVLVFYLRSDRLLRYYWAEKLREENK